MESLHDRLAQSPGQGVQFGLDAGRHLPNSFGTGNNKDITKGSFVSIVNIMPGIGRYIGDLACGNAPLAQPFGFDPALAFENHQDLFIHVLSER